MMSLFWAWVGAGVLEIDREEATEQTVLRKRLGPKE